MAVKTFTTGSVLTAADTNTYLANGGLVYVTQVTIGSGVSSVAISNCFSATYDSYKIVVSGGSPSANSFISLQLGASSTAYYQARMGVVYGGSFTSGSDSNTSRWTAVGSSLTTGLGAEITLNNPFLAKYTFYSGNYAATDSGIVTSGVHQQAVSYTDCTLYAGSGTWSGGTITVYGYRKA